MGWGLRVREGLLSGNFINRRLCCSQIYLLPLHPKSWDAPNKGAYTKAPVAELADALDLGSSVLRRAGSIPVRRTTIKKAGGRMQLIPRPLFISQIHLRRGGCIRRTGEGKFELRIKNYD